jgi:hypothetical protein
LTKRPSMQSVRQVGEPIFSAMYSHPLNKRLPALAVARMVAEAHPSSHRARGN